MTTPNTTNTEFTEESAKGKFTFKEWYAKNKQRLSEERKLKYDTDPDYKAKVKKQAKSYRAKIPPKPRKKSEKMTIPQLCDKAGCSFHTFRKFQKNNWVPKTSKATTFTEMHVKLLHDLHQISLDTRYIRVNREALLAPYITNLLANW